MCRDNAAAVDVAVGETVQLLAEDAAVLLRSGHAVRSGWPPPAVDGPPLDPADPTLRERLLDLGRRGGWLSAVADDVLSVQGPA
jgi:hypothetical protein